MNDPILGDMKNLKIVTCWAIEWRTEPGASEKIEYFEDHNLATDLRDALDCHSVIRETIILTNNGRGGYKLGTFVGLSDPQAAKEKLVEHVREKISKEDRKILEKYGPRPEQGME